jgi:hypothetical protein
MSDHLTLSPALFEDVIRGYVEYDDNDQPTEPRDITMPDVRLDPWRLDLEGLRAALVGLGLCDPAEAAERVASLRQQQQDIEKAIGAVVLERLGLAGTVGRHRIPVDVAQAVSRYKKWLEVADRATKDCRFWLRIGLVRSARAAWERLTTGDGDTMTSRSITVTRDADGTLTVEPVPGSPVTVTPIGTLSEHERAMFERAFGPHAARWLKDWPQLPQIDQLALQLTAFDINRTVARLRIALAPHRAEITAEMKAIRARRKARLEVAAAAYVEAKRAKNQPD